MKASEMILQLQQLIALHGDQTVSVDLGIDWGLREIVEK